MVTSALNVPNKRAEVDVVAADAKAVVVRIAAVKETTEATRHATIVEPRVIWRPAAERGIPARLRSGNNRRRRRPEELWTLR